MKKESEFNYPSSSSVTFNAGSNAVSGAEHGSKKQAENCAIIAAIELLKELKIWDITDLQ